MLKIKIVKASLEEVLIRENNEIFLNNYYDV